MRLIDADEFVSMNREAVHAMFNKVVDEAHPTEEQMSKATMFLEAVESVLENLEYAPTIDAVPVVRCKDCKYWNKDTLRHNSNDVAEWDECECEMLANRDRWNEIDRYCCDVHFCADGERKDNE